MTTDMTVKKEEGEVTRVERARDRRTYTPNVDIIETSNEFVVLADMPGVAADAATQPRARTQAPDYRR